MAKLQSNTPDGLRISTLAKIFEASREIEALLPMATTSTIMQLQKRLVAVSKNKEQVTVLFTSLERLQQGVAELGDTMLVRPTVHPLVERALFPRV